MEHCNETSERPVAGRFAPSPSGRMHLGNIYTAVMSWLSAKSKGGKWILRIEDLDPQRSKPEHARAIEEDLLWLGLEWDEGGLETRGPNGPYMQSLRGDIYAEGLRRLSEAGLTYRCRCRRADILATQAPHESDGRVIYKGTCRPPRLGGTAEVPPEVPAATRLFVPDTTITFTDRCRGPQSVSLARHSGDFILRRADGAWAYQLAVVMDDALMGVTEVVRGEDLLLSAAQQIHLYELLGYPVPECAHLPLVCNDRGERLSKRDNAMGMEALRSTHTPEELLGRVAALAGLLPSPIPVSLGELLSLSRER
ncbi:MAG: tRNA glutamyl-Q(34) synthetase GluQRS [Muribaculaceae bacterium]|nr:tRNA glutamyl-Q(34) synthetase GluQRS [Muribaculaceae bacterium]